MMISPKIFEAYGLDANDYKIKELSSGLINRTFKLHAKKRNTGKSLILQRVNTDIFKKHERIAQNNRLAADYLAKNYPDYFFITPVQTTDGNDMLKVNNDYWRVLPFIEHAVTINKAQNPNQAFEAAKQFGELGKNLSGIDLTLFQPTIPNFHNLSLRYSSFQSSINNAPAERKDKAKELIHSFLMNSEIVTTYEKLKENPVFCNRLMHHDTKINNVMFDKQTYEGVCVIDLDTLMPGKIISDLGDMIRTYVSPVSEEETDFAKIVVRNDYYEALMKGYLSEIGSVLTPAEKGTLFYAGQFMTYMQGLRYLTDYLNDDIYYGADYPDHNFNRAKNQLTLLKALNEKEKELKQLITKYL